MGITQETAGRLEQILEASSHKTAAVRPPILQTIQVGFRLFGGFMAYQPLYVTYCQIYFYTNNQSYFKQFNLT